MSVDDMTIHEAHRQRLYDAAQGAVVVLTAYDAMQQSGDMAAPFLQESSFWWLTGIDEPGWKLILDGTRRKATLFRPQRQEIDEIFLGGLDDNEVRKRSGIDEIIGMNEFEARLRQLRRTHTVVQTPRLTSSHETFVFNPAPSELRTMLKRIFVSVQDCAPMLHKLRAVKHPSELTRMQSAIDVTVDAFRDVHTMFATLRHEYEVEAEFTYRFRRANATHAYEPIVAAGAHACTLHYAQNSGAIGSRDMVVIDIGARVDGYAADITRTYCRRPTKRQRAVHAAVQRAQEQIIALIRPGLPVVEYITKSNDIMKEALITLGLVDDFADEATFRRYFPHTVSHGLGVDTHDSLGAPRYLESGMVLTVEPGIYIAEEQIGVRIEDDVLVTDDGHRNLSGALSTDL